MKFLHKGVTLDGALEGDSSLKILRRHVSKLWPIYALGVVSVIFTNVTDIAIPKYIQWGIDALRNHDPNYMRYVWPVALFLALQFVGRIYWRRTLGQQTHFTAARMKSLLWNRARYFPRERLETDLSPGELMNVATSDVGLARQMFGFTVVPTVDFVFLLGLGIAAMLSIDVQLTLATLVILPLVPFFVDKISRKESRQHKEAQESLSKLTELVAQAVATQRLQRVSQTHSFWESKLRVSAGEYRGKRFEVARTSLAFIPVTGAAPLVAYAVLLVLGVQKVLSDRMSVGEFVAMQNLIFIIQQPMLELGVIISEWQRSKASCDRVIKTLAQPEAPGLRSGGVVPTPSAREVYELRGLRFSYPGTQRTLIQNLNLNLEAGRRLGISGSIGTGKTTLLEILSGLQRGYQGDMMLYGREIREYEHSALRGIIAVVPQKPFLFGDTVRSNLSLDHALGDDEIWHWLEVAGVREDVEALSQGLDTRLGEWGVNLSGGQKQRLTLARALARRPRVLLLDDCLSAVDTVTEERILSSLDRELKDSTLVWVAHRPSTLRYCTDFLELGR